MTNFKPYIGWKELELPRSCLRDFPVFELCGPDRPDTIGMGMRRIFDAFSAQAWYIVSDHHAGLNIVRNSTFHKKLSSLLDPLVWCTSLDRRWFWCRILLCPRGSRLDNLQGWGVWLPIPREIQSSLPRDLTGIVHLPQGRSYSWCWKGLWKSLCLPSIYVSKVETTHFGDPLCRFFHIDAIGQVWQLGSAVVLCRWLLCYDYSHRPQEQPWPNRA